MTKRMGKNSFETDTKGASIWMRSRSFTELQLNPFGAKLSDGAVISTPATQCHAISFPDANYPGATWQFMLPSAWAGRTMICNFIWSPDSTNAGNCYWGLFVNRVTNGVVLPVAVTAETKTAITASGTIEKATRSSMEVSLATFLEGDGIVMGFYRDTVTGGTDTFTGVAYFSMGICRVK